MNTHDYLILSAAQERYAELLNIAEQERRLRAVDHSTPLNVAVWDWLRQWFRYRTPVFSTVTKG